MRKVGKIFLWSIKCDTVLTAITVVVVIVVTVVSIPSALGNLCDLETETKKAVRNDMIVCMANGFTRNEIIGCVEGPTGLQDSKK